MTIKTTLTAALIALAPVMGYAACSGTEHKTAMSCAEGMTYDTETGSCIAVTG